MAEPVPVRVRDCTCPGSPHPDGDVVYLPPTVDLEVGLQAEAFLLQSADAFPLKASVAEQADAGDTRAAAELERVAGQRLLWLRPRWFPLFVRQASGWNVTDENGPVPFDVDIILKDYTLARTVADAAAELYQGPILAPFTSPPPMRSRNGRTASGTHPPTEPTPLRSRSSSARRSAGAR